MNSIYLIAVSTIIQIIPVCYFIYVFTNAFSQEDYNFKKHLSNLIISTISIIIGILTKSLFPLNLIIVMIVLFLSLNYIFKLKNEISILTVFLFSVSLILCELITAAIFMNLLNTSAEQIRDNFKLYVLVLLFQSLLFLIFTCIINKLISSKPNFKNIFQRLNFKYMRIFLFLTLVTIIPTLILIIINNYKFTPLFILVNTLQLSSISIFIFVYMKKLVEHEITEKEKDIIKMDNKTLTDMVDGVRTIKHDFNNIFQSINAYLSAKHYDDLSDYVDKIMDECGMINTLSIINNDIFDDPGIYGIVGSKHFIATEKNIRMDLDVSVSFKEISFSMPDLSRILGVLLDNAIEATEKIENKYILFEAKFFKKKNATIIRVCNTYDNTLNIDLNDIYKKGVSSKKVKSGIGLWEVKKIIKRHSNSQIYTTIENNKFVQNIVIENRI